MSMVGVAVVAHGYTASRMVEAARLIVVDADLRQVEAIDAEEGRTDALNERVCAALDALDDGSGVLVLLDLPGASPCQCALAEGQGHSRRVVSGLNLAMLIKVLTTNREGGDIERLAAMCADAGRRAVQVLAGPERSNEHG